MEGAKLKSAVLSPHEIPYIFYGEVGSCNRPRGDCPNYWNPHQLFVSRRSSRRRRKENSYFLLLSDIQTPIKASFKEQNRRETLPLSARLFRGYYLPGLTCSSQCKSTGQTSVFPLATSLAGKNSPHGLSTLAMAVRKGREKELLYLHFHRPLIFEGKAKKVEYFFFFPSKLSPCQLSQTDKERLGPRRRRHGDVSTPVNNQG